MANCYRCGRKIEVGRQIRRRVKTGEWIRRRYPKTSVNHVQSSFGMRIVCKWCSKELDRLELHHKLRSDIALIGALVLVVMAMFVRTWGQ